MESEKLANRGRFKLDEKIGYNERRKTGGGVLHEHGVYCCVGDCLCPHHRTYDIDYKQSLCAQTGAGRSASGERTGPERAGSVAQNERIACEPATGMCCRRLSGREDKFRPRKTKKTGTSPVFFHMVRLKGIEPPHMVPETIALSTELQAYDVNG